MILFEILFSVFSDGKITPWKNTNIYVNHPTKSGKIVTMGNKTLQINSQIRLKQLHSSYWEHFNSVKCWYRFQFYASLKETAWDCCSKDQSWLEAFEEEVTAGTPERVKSGPGFQCSMEVMFDGGFPITFIDTTLTALLSLRGPTDLIIKDKVAGAEASVINLSGGKHSQSVEAAARQ